MQSASLEAWTDPGSGVTLVNTYFSLPVKYTAAGDDVMVMRMRDALNRYHIRQAHVWLQQRRIRHVAISGSAFKIGRRIIYYPITGGVRVGRAFEAKRGLHVLEWVLEGAGLLNPESR